MKAFFKKTFLLLSQFLFRYALGIILIWFGIMKFRNAEAIHLEQAMLQTILFKWLLQYITVYTLSLIIAWVQIFAGLMIMLKAVSVKISMWGGIFAMVIFIAGMLVFATSGIVWQTGYGFPELSRAGHAFIKDFILFGAAAWCVSDSI
jgi:uncharacterized membrane protein YkgB